MRPFSSANEGEGRTILWDCAKPPVQGGVKSGDDIALPLLPNVTEENPGSLRRVLYILLMRGGAATPATYNGPESECEDLGQFDYANEAGHLRRPI